MIFVLGDGHRRVWQTINLGNEVYNVHLNNVTESSENGQESKTTHSEAITTTVYPESHEIPDRLSDVGVLPVQIWLLR